MKKKTFGILAVIVGVLVIGIYGLVFAFVGSIPALASYMPALSGSTLSVPNSVNMLDWTIVRELSCCVCIPIPLGLGFFALYQQVKTSVDK